MIVIIIRLISLIRRPLLAQGRWIPFAFQQSSVLLSAISHLLLSCLKARYSTGFTINAHRSQSYTIKNPSISKSVSRATKIRKAAPKVFKKRQNAIPKSIKRDFHEELVFAIHSPRKPGFKSRGRPNFASETN